jgi:hypothetical protein
LVLPKRLILVVFQLILKLFIQLDLIIKLLFGILLDNSRLNHLNQLILMLFLNLEFLRILRTITLPLLVGMDSLKFGQFLVNVKLQSELMMALYMLLILTKMDNILLLEEKMEKLNFGNTQILKLLLKNGKSTRLLMMLKSLLLNIGLLLLLILRPY